MYTKAFSPLQVGNLTANNVYSLCKSTIDLTIPLKDYLSNPICTVLNQLTINTEEFQHELNKSNKNEFFEKLIATDKVREKRFSVIKKIIAKQVKGRDQKKKSTAQNLDFFFTPYWFPVNKTMDAQTGNFYEMFARYHRSNSLSISAKIIGVDLLLTELEIINNTYDALYKLRIFREAIQPDETLSEQKSELCNNYMGFCEIVEQSLNLLPNDILFMLFNKMNELRQKYSILLPKTVEKSKVV